MMVPQNWCRLKRKRVSHVESGVDEKPPESVDISIIRNTIDKHIQGAAEPDMFNDLDWLISKISVFRMLQNLPVTGAAPIPIVTRTYEESYMRECKTDKEKPCIFQAQCECMKIDPQNQFVGVQFPLPNVEKSNGMCLLCMRKTTHILFYNILRDGNRVNCTIQKYGNICNVAGEYHSSAMLICPPGGPVHAMPLPIVAHQRNRYSVVEHFGVKYMKQSGVYMEDFPGTLSSRA
jgi:hypothetical protein